MNDLIDKLPALKEAYPFKSHFCDLSYGNGQSAKLHYLDEGTGPVILMLHGNPTWSFYFRNCIHYFKARGFRCIVPDHMGCGLSDKPQDYSYTLERRIEDVQQLLKHTNVERYNLIVHDWGGAIGMGVAVQNPERVDKIALIYLLGQRSLCLSANLCIKIYKKDFCFPIKIGMTVLPWHDLLKISQCLKRIHLITVYWALKKNYQV